MMGALPLHCSEHLQVALLAILELRVRSEQHTYVGAHAELLKKRKPASLARELLLGFKPVQLYLESLQSRFGDVATICAGFQGDAMIGIKWRSVVGIYCLLQC